jgi:hypothetical protein
VGQINGWTLKNHSLLTALEGIAGTTGLEPAASAVTGQHQAETY